MCTVRADWWRPLVSGGAPSWLCSVLDVIYLILFSVISNTLNTNNIDDDDDDNDDNDCKLPQVLIVARDLCTTTTTTTP